MRRWLLGLAMLFVFAGVYAPPQADAKVVVVVTAHRRHRRHLVVVYRHGRRYRVYR
jgi:hypothetical protein